jgi:FKBP-type peptidyl-prolyl cis-trans isomerase
MNKISRFIWVACWLLVAACSKEPEVLSPADQLVKDTQAIDDYLATKNITAVKDPSGLRYVVTSQGTGAKPSLDLNVNINYEGKILESGQTFDKSTTAVTFPLYNLIQGWQIGLPLVNKGSKVTLYIPSGLGYGPNGSGDGSIPSNANLMFDLEILDDAAQLTKDVATIDKYLDSLKITAVKDPSGLRYTVAAAGTGAKPTLTNTVYYTYEGTVFKTTTSVGKATSLVSSYLRNLSIPGLRIGFQQIAKGSTATFYIPSSLAVGLSKSFNGVTIPPNSNLVFTIQFVEIN